MVYRQVKSRAALEAAWAEVCRTQFAHDGPHPCELCRERMEQVWAWSQGTGPEPPPLPESVMQDYLARRPDLI